MNQRPGETRRARTARQSLARNGMLAGIAVLFVAGCLPGRAARSSARDGSSAFTLGADVSALATPGRRRPLPAFQENGAASDEVTILRSTPLYADVAAAATAAATAAAR